MGRSAAFLRHALRFAAHDGARFVRERKTRQADERLERRVGTIHVGADHGERDLVARLVARHLEVSRAQALVIGLGASHFALQGLDSGLFTAAIPHKAC